MLHIYVGLNSNTGKKIFKSEVTPTRETHPHYQACVGPFRTMRAAKWFILHGNNNPHVTCVADAEWIAREQTPVQIYSVVINTPGYMPESEPYWTTNRKEALRMAASDASNFRDEGFDVEGNAEDGYDVRDPDKEFDLGYVIEVNTIQITRHEYDEWKASEGR